MNLKVVLAANDLPSVNDITYPELVDIISKVAPISITSKYYILNVFSNTLFVLIAER